MAVMALFGIFAKDELKARRLAWVWGSLLCATLTGLVSTLLVVSFHGGAVPGTQAKKVLEGAVAGADAKWTAEVQKKDETISALKKDVSDSQEKLRETENERNQQIAELKKEIEKLQSGEKVKEVIEENKRLVAARVRAEGDLGSCRTQAASLQTRLDDFTKKTAWVSARLVDSKGTFELNGRDLQTDILEKHAVTPTEHVLKARYPERDRNSAFFRERVYLLDSKQRPQWEAPGLAVALDRKAATIDVLSYRIVGGRRVPLQRGDLVRVELQSPPVASFGGVSLDRGRRTFTLPAGSGSITTEAGDYDITAYLGSGEPFEVRVTVIDTERVLLEFH
jgi:hypothetical protein